MQTAGPEPTQPTAGAYTTARAVPFLDQRTGLGIHQRRKLMEMRNQYTLVDEQGQPAGTVEQVQQSAFTFVARLVSDLDVALPVTLEVRDAGGAPVLQLHKPWFRMRVDVTHPDGQPLGQVGKQIRFGKARFTLSDPAGTPVGEVRAENWRARDFVVLGPSESPVARVTKQWRGLLTEAFTDADSYAIEFQPHAGEPLRSLAFAAALAVDLVMKQKD